MDPFSRKLFQSREARDTLRKQGGILASSPELADTVSRFKKGGPIALESEPDYIPFIPELIGGSPLRPELVDELERMRFVARQARRGIDAENPRGAPVPVSRRGRPDFDPSKGSLLEQMYPPQPSVIRQISEGAPVGVWRDDDPYSSLRKFGIGAKDTLGDILLPGGAETGDTGEALPPEMLRSDDPSPEMVGSDELSLPELLGPPPPPFANPRTGGVISDEYGGKPPPRTRQAAADTPPADADTPPADAAGDGGTADTPPPDNEPAAFDFDTTYDQMLTRLEKVMGSDADEDKRKKTMANLAMIGLAIAAGESPNALTNIAQGALTGMQAIQSRDDAERGTQREMRMQALKMASDQQSAIRDAELAAARDQRERDLADARNQTTLDAAAIRSSSGSGSGSQFNRYDPPEKVVLEMATNMYGKGQFDTMEAAVTAAQDILSKYVKGPYAPTADVVDPGIAATVAEMIGENVSPAEIAAALREQGYNPAAYGVIEQ